MPALIALIGAASQRLRLDHRAVFERFGRAVAAHVHGRRPKP